MPPNQQGQAAVTVNTKILKYLVLALVLCGTFGTLLYLAGVVSNETIVTVEPPIMHTLTTEKVLLKVRRSISYLDKIRPFYYGSYR